MSTRVAVAMSGGVDSSVAALLLRRAGHEVVGISMKLQQDTLAHGGSGCCSPEDFRDARAVARELGISYYVMNFADEFERSVVQPFLAAYRSGQTPSPCVLCNTHLKFRHLLARMRAADAAYVATGHYAGREGDGPWQLVRASDSGKDQTYFLFGLGQRELGHTLFPLARLCKQEVRELAQQAGLPVADKPESQEICFVPRDDYAAFVESRAAAAPPGPIVDREGRQLGRHRGLHRYTVGQRRGLALGGPRRLYVTRIDPDRNTVVVGDTEDLACGGFETRDSSWVEAAPQPGTRATVKIRHGSLELPCTLTPLESGVAQVRLEQPARAVAPGQAAVFYQGRRVLGGGWIRSACAD